MFLYPLHMNFGRPPYDEQAVALVVQIDEHIASLGPRTHQRIRRAQMIRAAIEGQVEYSEPSPSHEVLEFLKRALILELSNIESADLPRVEALMGHLNEHLRVRHET